jgi:hypothetical protein
MILGVGTVLRLELVEQPLAFHIERVVMLAAMKMELWIDISIALLNPRHCHLFELQKRPIWIFSAV